MSYDPFPSSQAGGLPNRGQSQAGQVDAELQSFIETESAKAQLQGQVTKLSGTCWDLCVDKARDKLDSRTETCISNCVDRFIDTAKIIEQRLQQKISRGGMM